MRPRESEFLPLLNYYLLKAHEHGVNKWIYRKHHMVFFTNQQFGMTEALPLGYSNVMFTYICLGLGICVSLLVASVERVMKKISGEQKILSTARKIFTNVIKEA